MTSGLNVWFLGGLLVLVLESFPWPWDLFLLVIV
jgi:hypothetical protein